MKNKINIHSIQSKMICYIIAIVIVLCSGLGLISYNGATSALDTSIDQSLQKISEQASDVVAARAKDHIDTLHAFSTNELFNDMKTNEAEINALLSKEAKGLGFLDIFMADKAGNAIFGGKAINVAQREYFQKAMNGTSNISDPLISLSDKTMEMFFAVPIKNANNEITGALVAAMDGNTLSNTISDVTFGKSGKAYVLNSEGVTIASYDKKRVLNQENSIENAKTDTSLTALADLQKKMIVGENGIGSYTYQGIDKYMGYHAISGTDWSIAVTAPKNEVFASVTALAWIVFLASLIFLVLSIFAAYVIARALSEPIKAATTYAGVLAKGDFTRELTEKFTNRKDEVGTLSHAFQDMRENLSRALLNINAASEQVASGSKQVSDSSMALSQGATEQASSIEELTASIEEIASQTKQNAVNAKEANALAESTKENADKGNTSMKEMLKAMADIEDSSNNISKIIKTIDDIAFQTNILALNAAVEAARAGQYGKGFAVVAEEVRNLAAKSAAASKETTVMIENSIKKVGFGTKVAKETSEALNSIVEEVDEVSVLVNEIAVASNEQASGISQINQGIMQVSSVVQANSATSEETAASSEELSGQAELLKEEVSKFKLTNQASQMPLYKGIDHSVDRMIDTMPKSQGIDKEGHITSAKKIALSDNDFGKY